MLYIERQAKAYWGRVDNSEISIHQIKIVDFVRSSGTWVTAKEIATGAEIALRTARHHASSLVKLGIFDHAQVFPAHKYRLSKNADKTYMARLLTAREVLLEKRK